MPNPEARLRAQDIAINRLIARIPKGAKCYLENIALTENEIQDKIDQGGYKILRRTVIAVDKINGFRVFNIEYSIDFILDKTN